MRRSFAMVFSSIIFLFLFLPVVVLVHTLLPVRFRNLFLLAASLLFYAWGEVEYTLVMLVSITMNYLFGLWVARSPDRKGSRLACAVAVAANLALLIWFKYANFLVENLNVLRAWTGHSPVDWEPIHLPLGISFFTFQAMSYVIDVHRRQAQVQRKLTDVALYITLYPQLIAGPIVRYIDVAAQIMQRTITTALFASGVRMFIIGLGKKVLIANQMAAGADAIFGLPANELNGPVAWLGVFFFVAQLLFDFGGYSDMAVGLGRMLGFEFVKNFNYPYISKSLVELWQRWHISLSTWFRDYLFAPLGGYRCNKVRAQTNLMIVFLLCGIWHGASWNFVIFGIYEGGTMLLERALNFKRSKLMQSFVGNLYFLWALANTFLIFRAADLAQIGSFLRAMYGFATAAPGTHLIGEYLDVQMMVVLIAAVIGSVPFVPWLGEKLKARPVLRDVLTTIALVLIFIGSTMKLAAGTHNPFIYFRF